MGGSLQGGGCLEGCNPAAQRRRTARRGGAVRPAVAEAAVPPAVPRAPPPPLALLCTARVQSGGCKRHSVGWKRQRGTLACAKGERDHPPSMAKQRGDTESQRGEGTQGVSRVRQCAVVAGPAWVKELVGGPDPQYGYS